MSAHTPGPWKVIPSPHGNKYRCVQIGADESYTTLEMEPADARLIAAAPELLDALAEACGLLQGVVEAMGETYPKTCGALTEHSTRFMALLVKATLP